MLEHRFARSAVVIAFAGLISASGAPAAAQADETPAIEMHEFNFDALRRQALPQYRSNDRDNLQDLLTSLTDRADDAVVLLSSRRKGMVRLPPSEFLDFPNAFEHQPPEEYLAFPNAFASPPPDQEDPRITQQPFSLVPRVIPDVELVDPDRLSEVFPD